MSEDEFNALTAKMRANHAAKHAVHAVLVNGLGSGNATGAIQSALGGLGGVPSGLGAGNVCAPPTTLTGAANGQSINGLLPAFSPAQVPLGGSLLPQWVTPADIQIASLLSQQAPAYGEQGPDTDGLAGEWVPTAWAVQELGATTHAPIPGHAIEVGLLQARIARKDGHEDDAKPSGCAHQWGADERCVHCNTHVTQQIDWPAVKAQKQSLVTLTAEEAALAAYNNPSNAPFVVTTADELKARIARKEAANEALVAKLEATLADMSSLQRQNEQWRAECVRLSALLVEKEAQLAQRMAMPANALRWGGGR